MILYPIILGPNRAYDIYPCDIYPIHQPNRGPAVGALLSFLPYFLGVSIVTTLYFKPKDSTRGTTTPRGDAPSAVP